MPIAADIYYYSHEEEGKLPVVLLHGAGGSHLSWPAEIRRLPGFSVFALDLPGHGKSTGRGHQSIANYSGSVMAWLDAIGIQRAVFVGHSMGSAIAQSLAVDHPGRVTGIGLIGSATRLGVNPVLIQESANETTYFNAVEKIVSWSFSMHMPENLKSLVVKRMAETRPSVLNGDLLACDRFDMAECLSQIQCPAWLLCGDLDKMTPVREAYSLAALIPNTRLEIIPEAGHMVMLEKPEVVAASLSRFLREVPY